MLARMSLCVAAVLMSLPVLAAASTDAAAPAAETPLGVAQRYAELVRNGEAGEAVDRFWNLDIMLENIFGEDLQRHTRGERTEMKQLLRDLIQRVNGDPRVTKVLQQTTLEGFRSKEKDGEPKTATVNYSVVLGKKRLLNTLLLQQSGERWVIVDGGAAGKMLVPAMRGDYTRQRTRYTPVEFVRELVRMR